MHLTRERIPFEAAASLDCAREATGAVVTFLGVVRADPQASTHVVALVYEAYETMAEARIRSLLGEARSQWNLTGVEVLHRIGEVPVGEIGLLIAVASPHRSEAYAASRFLIEAIKRDVPIWKRTHFADGTQSWTAGCRESVAAHVEVGPC